MRFKDLLDRKLGPMKDLVTRPQRPLEPEYDPQTLWYRRAAGLEVRVRPEESWSDIEVGRADHDRPLRKLRWSRAAPWLGLTRWRHARDLPELGVRARDAWSQVEEDLLYFAREDPGVSLTGAPGVLAAADDATRIARRASVWPTPAIQTAVHVAPMPFMPRGKDLLGAECVGVRLASLERDHEVLGVTITGTRRTGMVLRDLLPELMGRHTAKEILQSYPKGRPREDARKLLELLDGLALLEPAGRPGEIARRWAAPDHPQVTWLGHAGALVQAGGTNVLVDPLFNATSEPESAWTWPRKVDPRDLPPIVAVFITHGDNDHLNPNSLVQLPRDTPIYVPRTPAYPPPFQIDLRGVLRTLGFETIRELSVGDAVELPGLTVTPFPFEGEDWGLDLAQLTYLVEGDGLSAFFSADAASMDDVYRALGALERRVDLAFMGVSGAAEPMVSPPDLGYGNFYADWVPAARRNEWVQHCAGPAEAARSLALFEPRFAFGYACGGASYIPMEYCDRGDHRQLAERLASTPTRPVGLPLGEPVQIRALDGLPPVQPPPERG